MRRNYLELWLLLIVAFAAVALVSALSPIHIGPWTLRNPGLIPTHNPSTHNTQNTIPETHSSTHNSSTHQLKTTHQLETTENHSSTHYSSHSSTQNSSTENNSSTHYSSTHHTRLLFLGDSMLDGLYPRLAAYADHNGHELYVVIWYSSTSESWGTSDRLRGYISRLNPDYIFICLGANELSVRDIAARRERYVQSIIADIGDIPYLWIGPPNWKPDTGINDLIAANTAPGTFFRSDGMHFDRKADGAHPTAASAAAWMDSVARWMPRGCANPIPLEAPEAARGRARRVFVHKPGE